MAKVPKEFELLVIRSFLPDPEASIEVRLAYPTSTHFLNDLSKTEVNRLTKLGWSISKIVHLGMPYFGGDPPIYAPTYSFLCLIILPEKNRYIKSVCWNRNYLKKAHPLSVEETIQHEQFHLTEGLEERFKRATPITTDEKVEIDKPVKQKSVNYILEKYGKRGEDILAADTRKRYGGQAKGKTIISSVLAYWLRKYFKEKFNKYIQITEKLTAEMSSNIVIENIKQHDRSVEEYYLKKFGFRIN